VRAEKPTEERFTAAGGLPLLVRAARSLDVPASVKRNPALIAGGTASG
jgi:hypothetical protein